MVGVAALVLVVASLVMFGVALSQGVHCPHCDRQRLGDDYAYWAGFFKVKDYLLALGGTGGLIAVLAARIRLWGAIALAIALLSIIVAPK